MITAAWRCYGGIDLYARTGNGPWESQWGMFSEPRNHRSTRNLPSPKANILIDNNGHACLTGFGLLTMVSDQPTVISSAMTGGAIRWMSPERFDPGKFGLRESHPTKESDRYALGMVIYEVLSGETPYALCNQLVVVQKIMDGERPKRPEGVQGAWFTAGLWQILELCWKPRPGDRPSLNVVLQCLRDVTSPPRSSDVGGYMEADINDQSDTATSDFSTPSSSPFHLRLTFNYLWGI